MMKLTNEELEEIGMRAWSSKADIEDLLNEVYRLKEQLKQIIPPQIITIFGIKISKLREILDKVKETHPEWMEIENLNGWRLKTKFVLD